MNSEPVRCKNCNKYYDKLLFDTCPYCKREQPQIKAVKPDGQDILRKFVVNYINNIVDNMDRSQIIANNIMVTINNNMASHNGENIYDWIRPIITDRVFEIIKNDRDYNSFLVESRDESFYETDSQDNENFIPMSFLKDKDKQRELVEILNTCSKAEKILIQYYYYEHLSIDEISERMNVSKVQVKHGLKNVRNLIHQYMDETEKSGNEKYVSISTIPLLWLMFSNGVENWLRNALNSGMTGVAGNASSVTEVAGGNASSVTEVAGGNASSVTEVAGESAESVVQSVAEEGTSKGIQAEQVAKKVAKETVKKGLPIAAKIMIGAAAVASVAGIGTGVYTVAKDPDSAKDVIEQIFTSDEKYKENWKSAYIDFMNNEYAKGEHNPEETVKLYYVNESDAPFLMTSDINSDNVIIYQYKGGKVVRIKKNEDINGIVDNKYLMTSSKAEEGKKSIKMYNVDSMSVQYTGERNSVMPGVASDVLVPLTTDYTLFKKNKKFSIISEDTLNTYMTTAKTSDVEALNALYDESTLLNSEETESYIRNSSYMKYDVTGDIDKENYNTEKTDAIITAYGEWLKSRESEGENKIAFVIKDVDADGEPELILNFGEAINLLVTNVETTELEIYKYIDGAVVKLGDDGEEPILYTGSSALHEYKVSFVEGTNIMRYELKTKNPLSGNDGIFYGCEYFVIEDGMRKAVKQLGYLGDNYVEGQEDITETEYQSIKNEFESQFKYNNIEEYDHKLWSVDDFNKNIDKEIDKYISGKLTW